MVRVGVSGLTGMIGRNLVDWLGRQPGGAGLELVAFSRRERPPSFLEQAGIPCRQVDFFEPASFDGKLGDLQAFLHLAGSVRAVRPREFFKGNLEATRGLLAALERSGGGVRHLLFASSQTASGPSGERPADELDPCRPVSHYGRSKLAAEQAVRGLGTSGAPAWTVLRLPAVWGPYDRDGLNILRMARSGLLPVLGEPPLLSYIFAQDLAPLLARMVQEQSLYGGTFNVCYDDPVPLAEYLLAVRRLLGLPPRLRRLPLPRWAGYPAMAVLALARRLSGGESAATADKLREIMAARWVQSNARLKRALGLGPLREQGALAQTVRWFQERGLL